MTVLSTLVATTLDVVWAGLRVVPLAALVAVHLVVARVGDVRDRDTPIGAATAPRSS